MTRAFAGAMVAFWRGARDAERVRAFSSERSAVPAAVAAEQDWPRLRVWRSSYGRSRWLWMVSRPDGTVVDVWAAKTHGEALAVGLAALEQASAGWRP